MGISRYRTTPLVVAAAIGLAACGGETSTSAGTSVATSVETTTTETLSEETAAAEEPADDPADDAADATVDDTADSNAGADEEPNEEAVTEEAAAPVDPEAAAEANQPLLEPAENVLDYEVLDVADGSIATLGDAVDGDRPVLLWFFSPH